MIDVYEVYFEICGMLNFWVRGWGYYGNMVIL